MIIKNLKFKGISQEVFKILQERNRNVQNYIFSNSKVNFSNLYDLQIAIEIKEILPTENHSEGLAYDIIARTEKYLEPYFKLCELYKKYDLKLFSFTPLSTSSIPRHITIDTKILMENILNSKRTKENTVKSEKETVWSTVFKTDYKAFRSRSNMSLNGMIRTDGISICVLLSSPKPHRDENIGVPRGKKRKKPEKTEYFQDNLADLQSNKVYIDPNKRDLLYCLGSNEKKIRYTQMQRRQESGLKRYKKIRENLKFIEVELLHEGFFLKFYQNEEVYRQSIFRKIKLNTFINIQKSESKFIKNVRETFGSGENTTIIFGDWSKTSMKHQAPTKGKGFRKMFKKAGFCVFLCNEYLTSSICPGCKKSSLNVFKYRISPRPWVKRFDKVHGLLRCKSELCQQPNGKERLWNRDDVATLNIKSVVEGYIVDGSRPKHLCK